MPDHELVRVDPDDVHRLGQLVASSMYFEDAREAAQAAVKILAGQELGLGPIASMRGIDIIKGEVTLAANLVAALVRRSGVYDYQVEAWTNDRCRIRFYRHAQALDPPSEFTLEDARRAGLTGSNWQRYPRNMLFARAMTNGARVHCPDVFVGAVYTPDELIDLPPVERSQEPEPEPVPEGQVVDEWPADEPPDAPAEMITESQYGYLTGLIRQARKQGMKVEGLQGMLADMDVTLQIGEGWLHGLTRDQASGLIERLKLGLRTEDPAGT